MPNRSLAIQAPPAAVEDALQRFGRGIRVARLRRNLRIEDVATRIGVSRFTLSAIERGRPGVAAGACFGALWALGLLDQARDLADPARDKEGIALESVRSRRRVRRRTALDNDF